MQFTKKFEDYNDIKKFIKKEDIHYLFDCTGGRLKNSPNEIIKWNKYKFIKDNQEVKYNNDTKYFELLEDNRMIVIKDDFNYWATYGYKYQYGKPIFNIPNALQIFFDDAHKLGNPQEYGVINVVNEINNEILKSVKEKNRRDNSIYYHTATIQSVIDPDYFINIIEGIEEIEEIKSKKNLNNVNLTKMNNVN
jgi:hypothetical protein